MQRKIKTIDELKQLAENGLECCIILNHGAYSVKFIQWNVDTFYVYNSIDDSDEELTEEQIMDENIGKAMTMGGASGEMIATLDIDSTTGNYVTYTTTVTGDQNTTCLEPRHLYIYPWTKYYTPKFEDTIIPTHMVRSPFEADIFKSIRSKHNKKYLLQIYNITFKRQL